MAVPRGAPGPGEDRDRSTAGEPAPAGPGADGDDGADLGAAGGSTDDSPTVITRSGYVAPFKPGAIGERKPEVRN